MGEPAADPQELARCITRVYPHFPVGQVLLNTDGQNSTVLVINGEWIFRFPRYEHVLRQMRVETALLHALHGRLPLSIPEPEYTHLHAVQPGSAFMGYRCIPGQPLWREVFRQINHPEVIQTLANQLGTFLLSLHTTPAGILAGLDLERAETQAGTQDLYRRIQDKLFPLMSASGRKRAAGHFEPFLADSQNFVFQPVLRHGDFGTSNLIYDRTSGRLNGVIDFSFAALGDPAFDFAGLLSSYGQAFVERCQASYTGLERMLERVRFYWGTFALEEALFGYENGDEAALQAGLAAYQD